MFLNARHMFDPSASRTPDIEEVEVVAASDPRAVIMIVTIVKRRSKLKLILPRVIIRREVTSGSDILIMWVREAELRPRLELVRREP